MCERPFSCSKKCTPTPSIPPSPHENDQHIPEPSQYDFRLPRSERHKTSNKIGVDYRLITHQNCHIVAFKVFRFSRQLLHLQVLWHFAYMSVYFSCLISVYSQSTDQSEIILFVWVSNLCHMQSSLCLLNTERANKRLSHAPFWAI